MRSIIKYFLENPVIGNTLMLFLFILGFFGLMNMKSTLLPELQSRLITIELVYPGSSPQEVEEGAIVKIEENLKGLNGIERTSSVSRENFGLVSIEVIKDYDADLVLRDVKNAVDRVSTFPLDMEPPVITKQDYLGFAINFSLSGAVDLSTLKNASRKVEKELLALDIISRVELQGFPDEEIEISFREADLRRYQLTFDQALQQVRGANLEVTGGKIKSAQEELLIRARNKNYYAQDLREIVLKSSPDGGVIRLHQVATIRDKWEESPIRSFLNGEPAVVVLVQNTIREDMLEITTKVRDYVVTFNQKNSVIKATVIEDGSKVLNQRIKLLTDNGVIGFILVVIILALFLNWRLAFWVALAIPTSFAGMLIFVGWFGVTINLMSLFGMIIVIGILVDDGIVIAENIYQKYEEGMPPMEAALEGTMEVLPAVFGAIITTIVAFSGFFMVDGNLGEFGVELAIVVIISLVFSLIEGALILPAHVAHSRALKKHLLDKKETQKVPKLLRWWNGMMDFVRDKIYRPILSFSIHHSFPTIAICMGSLAIVIGAIQGRVIRSTFFPTIPSERFTVVLKLPAGTREAVANRILTRIEKVAWELNEAYSEQLFEGEKDLFLKIVKNIGPSTNEGNLVVTLIGNEFREELSARDITGLLRERVGPVYEAEILQYRIPNAFGKPVDISIMGSDYKALALATEAIEKGLQGITDLRDVFNNNANGLKEISLNLKPKAYHLGFTLGEIIRQVRQGFFGGQVQRLQRGVDEVKVWVRYEMENRSDLSNLAEMRIHAPNGMAVPLGDLATFSIERGVTSIYHVDGRREVNLEAEVVSNKVSVSELLANIQNEIVPPVLAKYPSIEVRYNGESREQEKTFGSLKLVLGLIVLVMFFIIVLTFKSFSQALIIFIVIPFGLVGVGIGHYVMDTPLSMVSMLGFIALIGILVNDALVFVTTFNDYIKKGEDFIDALFATGISRFRPIILTSVTTIVGLGPILLEKSQGAHLLIPMAISVAFGLMVVTVIILAMIPALLQISNAIKVEAMALWEGERFPRRELEPAFRGRKMNFLIVLVGGAICLLFFLLLVWGAFWVVFWF